MWDHPKKVTKNYQAHAVSDISLISSILYLLGVCMILGKLCHPKWLLFPLINRIQMILYSRCMSGFSKNCPKCFSWWTWWLRALRSRFYDLKNSSSLVWNPWMLYFLYGKKSESFQSSYLCVCHFSYKGYIGYRWFGWQNKWNPASYLIGWHSRLPEVRY